MSGSPWKIHKFGGTSLSNAECFRAVAGIISEQPDQRLGIVVSAMGGMTDALLRLPAIAERDAYGGTSAERKLTGVPSRLRTFGTFTVTGPIPV